MVSFRSHGQLMMKSSSEVYTSLKSRKASVLILCLSVGLLVIFGAFLLTRHPFPSDESSVQQIVLPGPFKQKSPTLVCSRKITNMPKKVYMMAYRLDNIFSHEGIKGCFFATSYEPGPRKGEAPSQIKFSFKLEVFASAASLKAAVESESPMLKGKLKRVEVGEYTAYYWENRKDGFNVDIGKLIAEIEAKGYREPLIETGKAANNTEFVLLIVERSGRIVDRALI